jgi:hypothetical protein
MAHGQRRSSDVRFLGAGDVAIGAAAGKMDDGVDLAGLERFDQRRRKLRGDRSINNAHLGGDSVCGQFNDQIGGAIFAGEIEQRGFGVGLPHNQHTHQIMHIAPCRCNIREAGVSRSLGAALADSEQRQHIQSIAYRIVSNRAWRIRAGHDDGAPLTAKVGGNWLYSHQRRHQHVMPTRAQCSGSSLAIRLRTGDDNTHDHLLLCMAENWFLRFWIMH